MNTDIIFGLPTLAVLQRRLSGNLQVVISSDGILSVGVAIEDAQRGRGRQQSGQDSEGESHFRSSVGGDKQPLCDCLESSAERQQVCFLMEESRCFGRRVAGRRWLR